MREAEHDEEQLRDEVEERDEMPNVYRLVRRTSRGER